MLVAGMFGLSFDKPAVHMHDYLEILLALIQTGSVDYEGGTLTAKGNLAVAGATPCPVLLAALGPKMMELAGSMCAGAILTMTGPRTIREYVMPALATAAQRAGRSRPDTMMLLPVSVTDDADGTRQVVAEHLAFYGNLPSYQAMLNRGGVNSPADIAMASGNALVDRETKHRIDATRHPCRLARQRAARRGGNPDVRCARMGFAPPEDRFLARAPRRARPLGRRHRRLRWRFVSSIRWCGLVVRETEAV